MIEYALLFGLGFLTAILAALLIAPAIHHRIVLYTEKRMRATMPLAPEEIRAQKDMVRAEMAARLAKSGQHLTEERHKTANLAILNEQLVSEAGRLYSHSEDLERRIEGLQGEVGDMRSQLRAEDLKTDKLRLTLAETIRDNREKQDRVDQLNARVRQLLGDIDNLRIELVTRDTEAESQKARNNALRDERDGLRNDLRLATQRAKDAELRLAREENRAQRLDDKLAREQADHADLEVSIARRIAEIARLKERLKLANSEVREGTRLLKVNGIARPVIAKPKSEAISDEAEDDQDGIQDNVPAAPLPNGKAAPAKPAAILAPPVIKAEPDTMSTILAADVPLVDPKDARNDPPRELSEEEAEAMSEEVRNQAAALSERLASGPPETQDEAIRKEIAEIAARMVAITAQREGKTSLIRPMLIGPKAASGKRVSLAERANRLLLPDQDR